MKRKYRRRKGRRRKTCNVTYYNDYAEIELTRGKVAIVDLEDVDRLLDYVWYTMEIYHSTYPMFYARANCITPGCGRGTVLMHRVIMDAPADMCVDHINGDSLYNRKENLRLVTRSENMLNTRRHRT